MRTRQSHRGFTLKQLIVALAIIAILAVLVYPLYQIARHRALEAKCRANLWAIYLKYEELKAQYRPGTPQMYDAFTDWCLTPEGREVIYCPLGLARGEYRTYHFSHLLTRVRYEGSISVYYNENLVAYCSCHRLPFKGGCPLIQQPNEKFLAVFDVGGGQVRYASLDEIKRLVTSSREDE